MLKPDLTHIQVVAENWPEYSDGYIGKLKVASNSHGLLWAQSPISGHTDARLHQESRVRQERGWQRIPHCLGQ